MVSKSAHILALPQALLINVLILATASTTTGVRNAIRKHADMMLDDTIGTCYVHANLIPGLRALSEP